MSLNLGGDGVITGCTSLSEPALTLSGLTVDTDTLVVDSANDSVGIGTSSPTTALEVVAISPTIKSRATGNNVGKLALDSDRAADLIGGQIQGQWNGTTVSRIDFVNGDDDINKDNGVISFRTAETGGLSERMRITSSGNVGIVTTNPSSQLQVKGTTSDVIRMDREVTNGTSYLYINADRTTTNSFIGGINFEWDNTIVAGVKGKSGSDTTNKDDGVLVFETASAGTPVERMRILSTGGITFNGDTAVDNALDDYEEGTWTPVFQGGTTAGSYTYATQVGKYTKIGNKVTVTATLLNITTASAGTGIIEISGLPFPQTSDYSNGSIYIGEFNVDNSCVNLSPRIDGTDSKLKIIETRDALTGSALAVTDKTSDTADIMITITYFTSA